MTRILIAEDSPTQAEKLRHILESEGYQVDVAQDGQDALEQVLKASVDLVISDIVMPRLSGYEFCRKIKDDPRKKHIPVVLLTSLHDPMDIIQGLECEADNFITKPYDPDYLLARLKTILENKRLRSQGKLHIGVDILFLGKKLTITSEKEQILDLLISTFEDVVRTNQKLQVKQEELAVAGRQFRILYLIAQALNDADTIGAMMDRVLDLALALPGVRAGWISLCDEEGHFHLAAAKGLPPALQSPGAFVGTCRCRNQLLSGELRSARNMLECERLQKATGDTEGLSHHASIPLWAGEKKFGLINLAGNKELFTEQELQMLQGVGEQVGISIERVSLREQLEAKLHTSEQKYRTLLENANDGIFIMDTEGRILEVNVRGEEILGRSRKELVGRYYVDFVSPSHADRAKSVFRELLSKERIQMSDIYLRKRDGKQGYADISAASVKVDDRNLVLAILRDVTERNLLAQQFLQAQKMEVVGRLAGGVAHDFNNLLTGIGGFAQLLLEKVDAASQMGRDLGEIRTLVGRASGLTRQLLAFSRQQPVEQQILNLNTTIENASKMLQRLIGEDLDLKLIAAPDLGNVKADPAQIEQVLMNLVVNARDAMPEGGLITIETSNVTLDADYVREHFGVDPGPYVLLSVSDNGCGIDPEIQKHIFEPFFTTKGREKGTGLGLSTVYGIIRQHQGNIWVYSEPNQGTTFKIYLPRIDDPVVGPALKVSREVVLNGSETILVAEDDAAVRSLVERVLKEAGYTVVTAQNGAEAEQMFLGYKRQIVLLLTDMIMPQGTGSELYKRLAERNPSLKVLYMSGYTDVGITRNRLLNAGDSYIQKPFQPVELLRKVRAVLDA